MKTHIIVRLVAAMCLATVVHVPATIAKRMWVGFLYIGLPPLSILVQKLKYVRFYFLYTEDQT